MKLLNIILGAALFAKSIFGYEINIIKPEYQSGNITLSDNITDIIDETVKDISSYSIHQNDIIINIDSKINENVLDLIDIIDDDAIKYMGNNEIKVNYPVLSLYMNKYKNLYDQYDVSNNKSIKADKETGNNKNDLARRDVEECMTNVMFEFNKLCIFNRYDSTMRIRPLECIIGGVDLLLYNVLCGLNNEMTNGN